LYLNSQAFANQFPGAVVYFPTRFDPSKALNVVVFIHGWYNCIQNVWRPVKAGIPCSKGEPARMAYNLIQQVEGSGKNVLLIIPEVSRNINSGNYGNLGASNGIRNLLDEILKQHLSAVFENGGVNGIHRLIVFGHSAAYQTTSAIVRSGGVENILREVHMLDSLYGNAGDYENWISRHKTEFAEGQFKYSNIYYASTKDNSVAQADRVKAIVPSSVFFSEKNAAVKESAAMYATPVLFKASSVLSHDGIPAAFVGPILAASPIE
jgi:hypothetical protein